MGIIDTLKAAGFTPEKSEVGGRRILEGTYKASFYDWAEMEDKGFGTSLYAQFKITETLAGADSNSQFPEFKDYYKTSPDNINSKRNGLAKFLNGFFSIGIDIDRSNDEAFATALNNAKGSVLYISAYKGKPVKLVDGSWVDNPDGEAKQKFTFLTEKNAMKKVKTAPAPF